MREPYSNHFVCLSVRLSVRLSVCLSVCPSVGLSTLCCNAITQTVFDLQTSYFIDKERKTPIDFGVKRSKVKVIVTCFRTGPSLTVSVFEYYCHQSDCFLHTYKLLCQGALVTNNLVLHTFLICVWLIMDWHI